MEPCPGKTIVPIRADTLTTEDKVKSLDAANLIKEELYGRIEVRTCDNGIEKEYVWNK